MQFTPPEQAQLGDRAGLYCFHPDARILGCNWPQESGKDARDRMWRCADIELAAAALSERTGIVQDVIRLYEELPAHRYQLCSFCGWREPATHLIKQRY